MASEVNGVLAALSGFYSAICDGDANGAEQPWLHPAIIVTASGAHGLKELGDDANAPRICGLRCQLSQAPAQVDNYRRIGCGLATVQMSRYQHPDRPEECPLPVGTFVLERQAGQPCPTTQQDIWRIRMLADHA